MYRAAVSADDDLCRVPAVAIDMVCGGHRKSDREANDADKTRSSESLER
jgi:hypothetical protein